MPKNIFLVLIYLVCLFFLFNFLAYSQTGPNNVVGFGSPVFIPSSPVPVEAVHESPETLTSSRPDIPVPTITPLPLQVSASDIANGLVWLEIPAINLFSRLDLAIEIDSANGPTFTEPAENPLLIPNWSADIGLPGVSIIYGHRQWGPIPKVFTDLDNLTVGDLADITSPGYRFTYKVIETLIINPADLWTVAGNHDLVAKSNNRNDLMLITCTPWGTNLQRLIIFLSLEGIDVIP